MKLSLLDYAVFILYMGLVVLIGFWIARKEKKSARHYFLAGNKLPWFAIGTSLIASSVSTEQFIGEVKKGRTADAFIHCIERCGDLLEEAAPQTMPKNELPDHLVVLE